MKTISFSDLLKSYSVFLWTFAFIIQFMTIMNIAADTNKITEYGKTIDAYLTGSGITVNGKILYMTYNAQSFSPEKILGIVDISNPEKPKRLSRLALKGFPQDLAINGSYLYVVNGAQLIVIDISRPKSPKIVKEFVVSHSPVKGPCGVAIKGNYAFLACRGAGLKIVDISNPLEPKIINICAIPGIARDVTIKGDYAYVAADTKGMVIVDIMHPLKAEIVGVFRTKNGTTSRIVLIGNYAILAEGYNVLKIADVSNVKRPVLASQCDDRGDLSGYYGSYCYDLGVKSYAGKSPKYVYLADGESGILVVDITNIENPQHVKVYMPGIGFACPFRIRSLLIKGNYLYANDERYGLRVIDISNPEKLKLLPEGVILKK